MKRTIEITTLLIATLVVVCIFLLRFEGMKNTLTASWGLTITVGSLVLVFFVLLRLTISRLYRLTLIDLFVLIFSSYMIFSAAKLTVTTFEFIILSVSYLLIYLAIRTIRRSYYPYIIILFLILGCYEAIYGNLQLYRFIPSNHGRFRLTGHFFNPGPYAGFLALICSMALPVFLIVKQNNFQIVIKGRLADYKLIHWLTNKGVISNVSKYGIMLVLCSIMLVIPAARSRAAGVAIVAVAIFSIIQTESIGLFGAKVLSIYQRFSRRFWGMLAVCLMLVTFTGLYFMKRGSADGRLLIWKASLPMVAEAPLIGWGVNGFSANYMNYQAAYFKGNSDGGDAMVADNTVYVFNEPLKLLIEYGVVGFLLVLILLYLLFFKTKSDQKGNSVLIAAKSALLAFLVFGFFSYPSSIAPINLVVVICMAIIANYTYPKYCYQFSISKGVGGRIANYSVKALLAFLIIGWVLYLTSYSQKRYDAYVKWKDASDIYGIGAYKESIDDFEEAYPLLKKNGEFLVNYGKALAMAKQPEEAIKVLNEAKKLASNTVIYTTLGDCYKEINDFEKAEAAYQHAYNMIPSRFYPLYLLANLYEESNQQAKAVEIARQVMQKPVKIQSRAIDEIKERMEQILTN